ncbi:MAG TPA: tetratricopeptide repeat protein [Allosphingosinicella sp.]|nr:tetratricopeptide repeat protein [Allosphingosinicella sp.]
MRMQAAAVLGTALLLSACATASPSLVEQGYERGALGVAALHRGDFATAETLLQEKRGVRAADPARLINLGTVYMETGRAEEAREMWRQALASDKHFSVETADGRIVSTEQLAREALSRHPVRIVTATR